MGQTVKDVTPKNRATFLQHFREVWTVTHAAAMTGIAPKTVYEWAKKDPGFAADFSHAREAVADMLEQEAIRRACQGINRPVYYKGQKVDTNKEYSDTLLIFLLKGQKPEKYGDKVRQEITGESGGPLRIEFGVTRPERPELEAGQEIKTIEAKVID